VKREPERLRNGPFELLVIGGGIYGAWAAYDAALRGLRVALVEGHDWASGTSSGSSKLIHGGLRYLEHGRLGLVRKSLAERRRLSHLAPHRIRPLRFVFPVYSGDRVGPLRLRLGMWVYDRLAGSDQPVPHHSRLQRRELLERYPFLRAEGSRGGFLFGDGGTDDARFTLEIVAGAVEAGATAVNRCQATELLVESGRVTGVRAEDLESGSSFEIRAGAVLSCAGPWIGELSRRAQPSARPLARLSRGVHLVMPALPTEDALVAPTADGRVFFLIPWYGRSLIGTTDTDYPGEPEHPRVEPEDVAYLLAQAGRVLGGNTWSRDDIVSGFAALRALPASRQRQTASVTREWFLREPIEGFLVSVGGKLTSARVDAARAVDRAFRVLHRPPVPCATGERPFPWAPPAPFDDWLREATTRCVSLGLDETTATTCALRYGSRIGAVLGIVEHDRSLAARIVEDAPFCLAEVVHVAREEMPNDLEDIVRRRIPLTLVAPPSRPVLERIAQLAGDVLAWDAGRRCREVDLLGGDSISPAGLP
jgi:glycerol-3-phosphate dehydrogenase